MNALPFYLGLAVIVLGLLVWNQHLGNRALQLEIQTVEAERDAHRRAVEAMTEDAKATERRNGASTAGKERVNSVPVGEDGPIAKTLSEALKTADEIGGLK
jgi:hypothetical protein